jgi:hypothetical protein
MSPVVVGFFFFFVPSSLCTRNAFLRTTTPFRKTQRFFCYVFVLLKFALRAFAAAGAWVRVLLAK